jgi:diacylglycerol kinase
MVKIIKDVAAGAVWWSALFSAIIGFLIFLPYVEKYLNL